MPSRLINEIKLSRLGHYQLWEDVDHVASPKDDIALDSPEYFAWLSTLRSFHFEGKEGRFTARLESRKNNDGSTREYWSAYRKRNKKQLRRYLGATDKLSISTLEAAAKHLTDVCNSQPVKPSTPRKKPVARAVLQYRIAERDRTIDQLQARVAELEQELTVLKLEKARWIVQSRERQI
jgi:hypothetical protein